jgi:hypothetical protein
MQDAKVFEKSGSCFSKLAGGGRSPPYQVAIKWKPLCLIATWY